MRLRKILFEEIRGKEKKLVEDCKEFISINKSELKQGNYLLRGTGTSYDQNIIEKESRKRLRVSGDRLKTFLYEKFRREKHPSREEMVPSQNGSLHSDWVEDLNVYVVMPVGNRYKLVYTPGVYDFNVDNPYFEYIGEDINTYFLIDLAVEHSENEKYPENIEARLNWIIENFEGTIASEYRKVKNEYGGLWKVLWDAAEYNIELKNELSTVKDFAQSYIENTKVTKKMPSEKGLEVNIYAPDGFYYIDEEKFKDILKEI